MESFRLLMVFACFGHAWFHVLVALFLTLVLVLEPAWRISYSDLIALWTPGALLLGLAAPVAGWLSDRWGEARLMIVYFLGIGFAAILCGLADGPTMLMAALALIGLFGAIYHPVGTAWVMKHARARGKVVAVLGVCGSIGAAFASLVAASLADLFDWRWAFVLPGALSIVAGLALAWAFLSGRVVDRKSDALPAPEPTRGDVRRAFAVLIVTMSLTTVAYYAFTTMLPKWLEIEVGPLLDAISGDRLLAIGALVTCVYLLAATAQFVGGYFSDRGAAKQVYLISFGLKLAALCAAALVAGWPVVVAAVVVLFVFDIAAPVENVLIARFTTSRRRGLAYGLRNGLTIAAGPLGVQLVAWLFDEATGFSHLLLVLAALVVIILIVALFLPGERPAAQSKAQVRPARS